MSTETTPSPPTLVEAPLEPIVINDAAPLDTAQFRDHPIFHTADPEGQVPDVTLGTAPLNPRDRPHRNEQRVGVRNTDGELVGAFNLA